MVDLSAYPVSLVLALFVGTTMVLCKRILEATVLKPTSSLHDDLLRLLAVALGVGLAFAYVGIPATRQGFFNELALGAMSGLSALGYFHLLSGKPSDPLQVITGTKSDPTVQAAVEAASQLVAHVIQAQAK